MLQLPAPACIDGIANASGMKDTLRMKTTSKHFHALSALQTHLMLVLHYSYSPPRLLPCQNHVPQGRRSTAFQRRNGFVLAAKGKKCTHMIHHINARADITSQESDRGRKRKWLVTESSSRHMIPMWILYIYSSMYIPTAGATNPKESRFASQKVELARCSTRAVAVPVQQYDQRQTATRSDT